MADIIVQTVERIDIISQGTQGLPGIQGNRGQAGPPGGSAFEGVAAVPLGGHRVVSYNAAGKLVYATNADLTNVHRIAGISLNAADTAGSVNVVRFGEVTEPSWNWNTSKPVFLGVNGVLTQEAPAAPAAAFSIVMGFPTSSTSLFVTIREPITLTT